jgi:hypothetical protein
MVRDTGDVDTFRLARYPRAYLVDENGDNGHARREVLNGIQQITP